MANLDFIYNRKSVRQFKNTPVPKEDIIELLKAGTYAPSPKHQQNWHFVVLQNRDIINKMADIVTKSHENIDRKSTRLNSSHITRSRMPSSA